MSERVSADLLLLFLGLDDKVRAPPHAWEYLTIRDLVNLSLVSKNIRDKLQDVEYTKCRDGKDYFVPFPGFPGLLSTPSDLKVGAGLFPHQLASLAAMHRAENSSTHFDALRGGILGDAPGLGKTITMLALIASTAGIRPVPPPEFWADADQSGINEGWQALRQNPASEEDILRALKPIRKWIMQNRGMQSKAYKECLAVERYVTPVHKDGQCTTIEDFEWYVLRRLRKFVPVGELELFRKNVMDLKEGLDKRNRKLLKSEIGRRLSMERRLVTSSATLIVVPDALLEHWFQQIHKHLNLAIFADENENQFLHASNRDLQAIRGVVYLDGIGDLADIADARKPLSHISLRSQVPTPWQLSKYLVVVASFSRIEAEFQKEVDLGRIEGLGHSVRKAPSSRSCRKRGSAGRRKRHHDAVESDSGSLSSLLKIRWLRLVVDEGHELGTHEAGTGVSRFINQVAAERRWVLSGTPTTGDEDETGFVSNALDQLQRLLYFLRHPKYGDIPPSSPDPRRKMFKTIKPDGIQRMAQARSKWGTEVKLPFLKKESEGRQELLRVLKEIMVMHRKEDIHLPQPIFRQAEANVWIPDEVQERLKANINIARGLEYYLHSEEFQTFVDERQAAHIVKTIQDARHALLQRGGNLKGDQTMFAPIAALENMDKADLRPVKAVVYSSNHNILLSVTEHLLRKLSQENIAEMYESPNIGDMNAELSRFRHGCRECKTCPICKRQTDAFGKRANHCDKYLLEVVTTSWPRARFLIEPERIKRSINVPTDRLLGELPTSYGKFRQFWRPMDILEVDIRDPHPLLCRRESEETWEAFGSNKCQELAALDFYQGHDWYFGPLPKREKDVVEVELVKWQHCSMFHSHTRWFVGPRFSDGPIQKIEEDVCLLSLDASLSHGLDLSFVTHIFLLEAIEDAALLEQVTSRAHRLGATGPVTIETVNTFYNLSKETSEMLSRALQEKELSGVTETASKIRQNKQSLSKVVCHYCYREFDCRALAEEHELAHCPRNPANIDVVDSYHLSSVYREIRPPPAIMAETVRCRSLAN